MTHQENLTSRPVNSASFMKHMLIGGGIGLCLIAVFIAGVRNPNPVWGQLWYIKPLIMATLAGAGGGLFFYFMNFVLGYQGGWSKIIAVVIGLIGFIIAIWLGAVLGLNGTLWN